MRICDKGHEIAGENAAPNGKSGVICRICRNERKRHLYWDDPERSRADGRSRMRKHLGPLRGNAQSRKTHCPQNHLYDEENTYVTKSGSRQCKKCRRVRVVESWWRHRDKRLAENQAWREANPERIRQNLRRWAEENRDRSNLLSRLKKQRRRAAGILTAAEWELVLDTYGNACLACGRQETTIDHVVPVSSGGTNTIGNVQPLCSRCNTSKGTKTIDYRPFPIDVLTSAA